MVKQLDSCCCISIHPPRVGRDHIYRSRCIKVHISIHPPRVGRDLPVFVQHRLDIISIHPPRVGRDHVIIFKNI